MNNLKTFVIIAFAIFLNNLILAQTKIVTIDEKVIKWVGTPLVNCSKKAIIDIESNDTVRKYISFSFQNAKYTHIIDTRAIIFNNETDTQDYIKFKKDLNKAIENIESQDAITFKGINYEIYVTGNKSIWLYDTKNGYTGFFLKQALKLKEWVDSSEL